MTSPLLVLFFYLNQTNLNFSLKRFAFVLIATWLQTLPISYEAFVVMDEVCFCCYTAARFSTTFRKTGPSHYMVQRNVVKSLAVSN
jgi:hypothetical protein